MSTPVVNLVARYIKTQEKRAAVELGQYIRSADNDFHLRLSHNLSKNAFGEEALQYLSDIISSAKTKGDEFAQIIPGAMGKLREVAKNPVNAALMGGAAGGLAGAGAGVVSGNNVLGKALQGGVAGATLGGGASLAGNALSRRGQDSDISAQVGQLTEAIDGATDSTGTNYGAAAGGLAAGTKAVNLIDNAAGSINPVNALASENMNNMNDRMSLIKRLEQWNADGGKKPRVGSDSVDAFIELLQKTDNPAGSRTLFKNLTNVLGSDKGIPGANAVLGRQLQSAGLPNGSNDISAILRAMQETRESGFQFLPRNILGRLGIDGSDGTRLMPLQQLNSALSRPMLRGRNGALMALAGVGGLGAYDMYNASSSPGGSVDPGIIQNLRDQLKSQ